MALADEAGIPAVTMRAVGQRLRVEAMSLYKHVSGKEALLDGLVELVFSEMLVPMPGTPWREALRSRAASARAVLLRHRWAATLVESRLDPGPMRLRHHEGVLRALREAGFSVALAYAAFLTLDSYIYGFVMQEVAWPFEPEERPEIIDALSPAMSEQTHPHLLEVMRFVHSRGAGATPGASSPAGADADFVFGLELVLDGLARVRSRQRALVNDSRS